MKTLKDSIIEKLVITKDTKLAHRYTCYPQNKNELRKIIEERIKEDENADLNDIDVSKIKDMSFLFYRLYPYDIYNIDISKWDVHNVYSMNSMFEYCKNFNCDLSEWNVENVSSMWNMFHGCKNFEGKGLEKWNPNKCSSFNMDGMFNECYLIKNLPTWYKI